MEHVISWKRGQKTETFEVEESICRGCNIGDEPFKQVNLPATKRI